MAKRVDMIGWLPPYVAAYKEIQQIAAVENPEFDILGENCSRVQNNQYILTCDLEGVARFEKMLGIVPQPDDDLDIRRGRCLMQWNEMAPYTYRSLKSRLDAMCGAGNYQIFPMFDHYALEVVVSLERNWQTEELDVLLRRMAPANIAVSARNELVRVISASLRGGGAVVEHTTVTLKTR